MLSSSNGRRHFRCVPPHKFRLLRRANGSSQWECLFDGIETMFIDTSCIAGSVYEYQIVAWNVVGSSNPTPGSVVVADTGSMYGVRGCGSSNQDSQWHWSRILLFIILLPLRMALLVIDNHYRISGIISLVLIALSWGKFSSKFKIAMRSLVQSRVLPKSLRLFIGTTVGNDSIGSPDDIFSPHEPLTPTSRAIREAAKLAFRSSNTRNINGANGDVKQLVSLSPVDAKDGIDIISRASSGISITSDTSSVSSSSVSVAKKRSKSKWRIVRRAFLRGKEKKNGASSNGNNSPGRASPSLFEVSPQLRKRFP